MVYMITYDLNSPGQNYKKVKQAIIDASTGVWITCSESSYLIQSYFQTADEIFSIIDPALDKNDNIFIVEVKDNKQGYLPKNSWDYINNKIF